MKATATAQPETPINKPDTTKLIEDIREFLKNDMELVTRGPAPYQEAMRVCQSRDFKIASDLTEALYNLEDTDSLSTFGDLIWKHMRLLEDCRVIYQTCLQILLGNADDEEWLHSAIEEIKSIANQGVVRTVDESAEKLLKILKQG